MSSLNNDAKNLINGIYTRLEFYSLDGTCYRFLQNYPETSEIDIRSLHERIYNENVINNNQLPIDEARPAGVIESICPIENADNQSDLYYTDQTNLLVITEMCRVFRFYIHYAPENDSDSEDDMPELIDENENENENHGGDIAG